VNGVSQWDDLSGNGNHSTQSVTANKPTTDANGAIVFDGTDDYLIGTDPWTAASDSAFTVFIVGTATDVEGPENLYFSASDSRNFLVRLSLEGYDSLRMNTAIRGASNVTYPLLSDSTLVDGNDFLFTYGVSENTEQITGKLNGGATIDSTLIGPFDYISAEEMVHIGTNTSATLNFFNGKISLIAIYDRKLTPAEITEVENAINTYFSIY